MEDGKKLAEQHANLATGRESVLHDIDMSPGVVLDLRTRLGTLTAIERLLNEPLAEILITFVHDHYYSDSARRDY